MGFFGRLFGFDTFDAAQRVLAEPYEPFMGTGGIPVADPGSPLEILLGQRGQVEEFWRTQPNLRKVVDYVARSVASIPMHAYERVSDLERRRVTDHPLARTLASPQPRMGAFRFWHAVISDGLLYDRWCVLKDPRAQDSGRVDLLHIPSWRLRFKTDPLRRVTAIWYWTGDQDRDDDGDDWVEIDLDAAIFDYGYAPRTAGLTPVRTLRDVLEESAEAVRYRRDHWENGARTPGYIHRPSDAAAWTPDQQDRFITAFRASYGKQGPNAGGMPILEDGMEIRKADVFSPQAAADLEGRQLTAVEVAAAYHIPPELVGARQGNYSNVREYRQMLYRDSLGPYIKAWEDALNAQLVPDMADGLPLYAEANVEAKLRGSFEEQAKVTTSAVGGPWMTVNEARAMRNMPPVESGDELIVPMNVTQGGQASPLDSGTQNEDRDDDE